MIADGDYKGKVVAAWVEIEEDNGNPRVCFDLEVPDQDGGIAELVASHPASGEYGYIGQAVCKLLKLEFPGCLREMKPAVGQEVPVRVKTRVKEGKSYTNTYIITAKPKTPANNTQIEMAIAKLEAKTATTDDGIPF